MQHRIDPQVDCVFKALLGREDNRALLINFLNAFLGTDLVQPITQVDILNPYIEQEFIGDKLSIVDVKASDAAGRLFQIEIQITVKPWLRERIVYNWTSLYSGQILQGDDYKKLRPVYSIWLIAAPLLADSHVMHRYQLRDDRGQRLDPHGGIWLLDLSKFAPWPR